MLRDESLLQDWCQCCDGNGDGDDDGDGDGVGDGDGDELREANRRKKSLRD